MLEAVLPSTKIEYKVSDHAAVVLDVIDIAWLVDDWMEEFADEDELKRDRILANKLTEWLNQQEQIGQVPYQFTRSNAVAFLLGLKGLVDMVKKKLADPQSWLPSTVTTSFPNAPGSCSFSGSSETKYNPSANLPSDNPAGPPVGSDTSS